MGNFSLFFLFVLSINKEAQVMPFDALRGENKWKAINDRYRMKLN
jgi:hypothetical protein